MTWETSNLVRHTTDEYSSGVQVYDIQHTYADRAVITFYSDVVVHVIHWYGYFAEVRSYIVSVRTDGKP